jgi:hypothetical protein
MGRRHALAAVIVNEAGQQAGRHCPGACDAFDAVACKSSLHLVPQRLVDDGVVQAGIRNQRSHGMPKWNGANLRRKSR